MSVIPLHLQRRFEQRWAARFAPPAASTAPKNLDLKQPVQKRLVEDPMKSTKSGWQNSRLKAPT
jgi:hypothetical protein